MKNALVIDTMNIPVYAVDPANETVKVKVARVAVVARPANVGDFESYARNVARAQLVAIYNKQSRVDSKAQDIIDSPYSTDKSVEHARKNQTTARAIMSAVTFTMEDLDIDTIDMTYHHGIADVTAYIIASPMRGTRKSPNYFEGARALYDRASDIADKGTMSDKVMKDFVHDVLAFMDKCTADDGEKPEYTREYRNKLNLTTARTIVHNVGAVKREYRRKGITENSAGIREFQKDVFCAILKNTYHWEYKENVEVSAKSEVF